MKNCYNNSGQATFSSQVKDEIEKHLSSARHCQIAEMAAYILNLSTAFERNENDALIFNTDNLGVINKIHLLLRKTYGIETTISENASKNIAKTSAYYIGISDKNEIESVLKSIKFSGINEHKINDVIVKNACCKRAYLRGSFACIGSMTSPEKGYHLEFVSAFKEQLEQLKELIHDFEIEPKITSRKKNHVLYIKEGAAIVDLLNIMGAHVSLMNMENAIILKDMRNDLNRKVNCEAANIIKSINASNRQVEDIKYIKAHGGFGKLPDSLKQMAEIRLKNQDTPLKDLGGLLEPPVGKSGVNHRLRRLSEIAEELRKENGDV